MSSKKNMRRRGREKLGSYLGFYRSCHVSLFLRVSEALNQGKHQTLASLLFIVNL